MILVVVVHYGRDLKLLQRCAESFLGNEKDIRFVIVNNNDFSLDRSSISKDERLSVINSKKNLGYGGGFNQILKTEIFKKASSIVLVNNDTYISMPILRALEDALIKEKAGITGPVVEYIKNGKRMYDLGGYINMKTGFTYHKEAEELAQKKSFEVDFLGVCLLISKDLLKKLKGFDEDFFLYYEDVDFCLRAKKIGFKTITVPETIIFHELSKTVGKESSLAIYNQTRGAILYMRKHVASKKMTFYLRLVLQSFKRLLKSPLGGIYAFKAMLDAL